MDSWGEHERQRSRTTAADRKASARIESLLEPVSIAVVGHFIDSEAWETEAEAVREVTREEDETA